MLIGGTILARLIEVSDLHVEPVRLDMFFGYFVMDKLKEYMVYLPQECPVWLTASTGSTFETVSFSTSTVAEAIVQRKKSRRLTGVLHIW